MAGIDDEDYARVLAAALHGDPSYAASSDVVDKLALLFLYDGQRWMQCKAVLKQYKVLKDVEGRVKARAFEMKNVGAVPGADRAEPSLRDVWEGIEELCPVAEHMYPPLRYKIHDDTPAIERLELKGSGDAQYERAVHVSPDPVVITRRIGQVQSSEIKLEVAWRTHHGWRKITMPRDTFLSNRKIIDTAAKGFPVGSGNAAELAEWLRHLETANRYHIPEGYSSIQMGWQGDESNPTHHGFLCGASRQIGANGRAIELDGSDGDMAAARGIRPRGTMEGWQEAVRRLWSHPSIRLGVYAALATPLIAIVGAPNGILEWAGRTSRGKTTVLQVAKSCWSTARVTSLPTWDTTIVGVEAQAKFNCDLPIYLDETSLASEGGRNVSLAKAIYKLIAGRDRGRGDRDSRQRTAGTWRTLALVTGETPIADLARAEGAAARVLTFWGPPFGEPSSDPKELKRMGDWITGTTNLLSEHYGHAGPKIVQWLCDHRDKWGLYEKVYHEAASEIRGIVSSPAASRLANVVAILVVAAAVAHYAGVLPWIDPNMLEDSEVVGMLVRALKHASRASDQAREAHELICSEAQSKTSAWIRWGSIPAEEQREPHSGWMGYYKPDDRWGFYPHQLRTSLTKAGYNPDQILRAWKDVGVLIGCDKDRFNSICKPKAPSEPGSRSVRLAVVAANYPGSSIDDDIDPGNDADQGELYDD